MLINISRASKVKNRDEIRQSQKLESYDLGSIPSTINSNIKVTNPDYQSQDYSQRKKSNALPKLSSKMMVRSDPKFQSDYNIDQDQHVILPKGGRVSSNDASADDEFKWLMNSSQYSAGNGGQSPQVMHLANKSSVGNVRGSKFTIFPSTIEKPGSREKRSRELFNAGESIISHEVNMSNDQVLNYSKLENASEPMQVSKHRSPLTNPEYLRKSSEYYPTTSTAIPSNSTMIRIRGKNNNYMKKKASLGYTEAEENKFNLKRKDVIKALGRLKKIEMLEQKLLGKVKDEIKACKSDVSVQRNPQIVRLEEERMQDEEERKLKRKQLFEQRKKLINERKALELKKQKRLEEQSNA